MGGNPVRDVPGATADIRDRGTRPGLLDQAGQQRPVERLAGELAAVDVCVLPGNPVITARLPEVAATNRSPPPEPPFGTPPEVDGAASIAVRYWVFCAPESCRPNSSDAPVYASHI
jgi:hypothetical protein